MRQRVASFSPESIRNLYDIEYYVAARTDPSVARAYTARALAFIQQYALKGLTGTARPDIGPDFRAVPYGRFLVVFSVLPSTLAIHAIVGAAQDLPKLLGDPETP